ncbi:MAG TPA: 6-pyruvoyl-tetrahydropterin synthase-related protein, partial [Chloroflexota bacterium]|nr:6-pyruvoyl-tetrahydropterin synthase-related protein [Chloroflexota bacterium]
MVTAAPAAGAVPAERSPALSRRAGAVSALRRAWPWLAALLVAIAIGAGLAFAWLDPRYNYLVDDGPNHADRVGLFDALLRRDGASLYPRWWPDLSLGYGYPLLTFYSPGVYYLAEAAHVLGASTHRALPLVAFGTVLLGTSGAFTLGAVSFRSPLAALVLATVYAGAPYPFVTNLYNRSAFPEAMGLAVLPWLLVAGTLAVQRPGARTALALALCLAALVLLHNLSALVGAAVLALWAGATLLDTPPAGRRDGWRGAAGGAVLGLALCAFFWVPAIFERGAVHTSLGSSGILSFGPWLFDPLRPGPVETAITVAERYRITPGPVDLNLVYPHAPRNVPGPVKPGLAQGLFLLLSLAAGLSGWLEGRLQRTSTARATDPREPWPAGLPMAKAR